MPTPPPTLSRRTFLRTSAGGALAALLAGCTPLLTTPPASSPTSPPSARPAHQHAPQPRRRRRGGRSGLLRRLPQLLRQLADVQRAGLPGRAACSPRPTWPPPGRPAPMARSGALPCGPTCAGATASRSQPTTSSGPSSATWRRTYTAAGSTGSWWTCKARGAYYTGETTDAVTVGIRALDDRTLEVALENPAAYFLNLATLPSFMALPRHVIEQAGQQDWIQPEFVAGNGPFLLTEWIPEQRMVFVPNPGLPRRPARRRSAWSQHDPPGEHRAGGLRGGRAGYGGGAAGRAGAHPQPIRAWARSCNRTPS